MNQLKNFQTYSAGWRILCFLLALAVVWSPLAIILSSALAADPNQVTIATMGWLFVCFLGLQKLWAKYLYGESRPFENYGLANNRLSWLTLLKGLALGFCFCWGLFLTQALFGWVEISSGDPFLMRIVLEGLLSALGIALAEELVFRGWVLWELERDYSQNNALKISTLLFAVAHFLKPLAEIARTAITFPALLLLGITLVWAKRKFHSQLTAAIGIHGGLVWGYYILNVGGLISYSDRVPDWITGIDGNPIAGVLGLVFMSVLAWLVKPKATY